MPNALLVSPTAKWWSEYRVRHANGEWRTFHNREIVFRRTPDGTPQQILGTAQDVTESRRIEELLRQGVIPRQALGEKLREFRETKLRLSQTEFGRRFGGYSQRQISHYENGEVEIPLRLLLTIAAQGYPFEEVLGADTAAVMHDTLRYVASSHWLRITGRQIIDILGQMLDRDREAGERVLDRFGVSAHGPSKEQEHLLALLVQLVAPRAAKT